MRRLAVAMLIFATGFEAALAHDPYREWRAPSGTSCCHRADCGVWDADDIEPRANGSFYVRSLNVTVTKERILPSPDGKTHMCCVREGGQIDGPCRRYANGMVTVRCIAVPMGY